MEQKAVIQYLVRLHLPGVAMGQAMDRLRAAQVEAVDRAAAALLVRAAQTVEQETRLQHPHHKAKTAAAAK